MRWGEIRRESDPRFQLLWMQDWIFFLFHVPIKGYIYMHCKGDGKKSLRSPP